MMRSSVRLIHSSVRVCAFKTGRGTGDKGQSSLFSNERRWKDDPAFEALGAADELTSQLGVCRESLRRDGLDNEATLVTRLQCCLQDLASHVATPPAAATDRKKKLTAFDEQMVQWLNAEIDRYGDALPPLRQFILPGGGESAARLQLARSVCRRAERTLIPLLRDEAIHPQALTFINRLSDLLFVLGRWATMKTGSEECTYLRPPSFTSQKWQRKVLDNSTTSK